MPRTKKQSDMGAQGEVNRCHAATIIEFVEEKTNDRIRSVGQLTTIAFEMLSELLVRYAGAREVTDTHEATQIVEKISYGSAFLNAHKYASAALKNMNIDAEEDIVEFGPIPQPRGRKPQWSEDDALKLRNAAEKALNDPRIQKLLNGETK